MTAPPLNATPLNAAPLNAAGLHADARRERTLLAALTAPTFLILSALLFLPVGWLFWLSVAGPDGYTLENYTRMVVEPAYASVFRTTFELSLLVTALTVLLGYPLTYMLVKLPPRASAICMTLVLVPFWTALLVRTYAWLVLLQRHGVVNSLLLNWGLIEQPIALVYNFTGTVIGMLHIMIPFLVLPAVCQHARHRPGLRARRRQPRRQSHRRLLASLSAALHARPHRRHRHGLRHLPGLLRGPAIPRRRAGHHDLDEDQQNVATYFDWGAASSLGVVLFVVTAAAVLGRLPPDSARRLTEGGGA